jgi:probable H4MPT-linked C1 transfer pathway protein
MDGVPASVVGWDIGGVNTKAAALVWERSGRPAVRTAGRFFEVWREPGHLPEVLRSVYGDLGLSTPPRALAVTMTAELSDAFRTKSDGVLAVLEAVEAAFPDLAAYALRLDERFVPVREAQLTPGAFAAANWLAAALYLAARHPSCLWIDAGSTTTDVIPIVGGAVCARGRTDSGRLAAGELVYTGILRTVLGAVAPSVPLRGQMCRTSPELFATTADVHLALGHITPAQYTCPTADGRAADVEAALERISRVVCADPDTLSRAEASALARAFYEAQVATILGAALQVLSCFPAVPPLPVLASGTGAFLGREVARRLRLPLLEAEPLPPEIAEILPSYAAATLLSRHLGLEPGAAAGGPPW